MPVRIKDVAERAGVSSATVSRVLANKPHISQEMRARVLEAVEALGYRPNRIARSLRVQRSSIIGLVISDIQNPFFNTVVRAVEDTVYEHGYGVFLCNSDENQARERLYLDLFLDEQVAGVILTPTYTEASAYEGLLRAEIPLTLIDRRVEGLEVDSVVTDNAEAAYKLVKALIGQGHSQIAALFSELSIMTGQERFEGYQRALKEAGLPIDDKLVYFGRPVRGEGYRLTQELLTHAPAQMGLFTGSKLLTLGSLQCLYERGIQVPEDISLAAFDALDWLPNQPPMLIAEQPAYELGQRAAELLIARIQMPGKPPEQIVLPSVIKSVGRVEDRTYAATSS